MRTVILVAVILQLAFIQNGQQYEFGDIISFKRFSIHDKATFKHFAVYVGDRDIEGKQKYQDIFQRTGTTTSSGRRKPSGCVFDKLENERKESKQHEKKENYLDGPGFIANPDEMIKRILEMRRKCGAYRPLKNNCEHLATYVRYGIRCSLQNGTFIGDHVSIFKNSKDCEKIKGILSEAKPEMRCDFSSPVNISG